MRMPNASKITTIVYFGVGCVHRAEKETARFSGSAELCIYVWIFLPLSISYFIIRQ